MPTTERPTRTMPRRAYTPPLVTVRRTPGAAEDASGSAADGAPLAFAGLWAIWRDPQTAERLYSATILTTAANELVAPVHDRMPVILDPRDWDAWLDESASADVLRSLLRPAPAEDLVRYAVSPAVSNVRRRGRRRRTACRRTGGGGSGTPPPR